MLSLSSAVCVFVARSAVDFRRGIDGLCGIVRDEFGEDPLSGHWFVFINRRRAAATSAFADVSRRAGAGL